MKPNKQTQFLAIIAGLLFSASLASAQITIPVLAGTNQVGVISVGAINQGNTNNGVSGSFTTVPNPPNAGSLAAAATALGEDHFNWYQVVIADNQLPTNYAGQALTAPYVDVPPGGYSTNFDNTWADNLPWYFDEGPTNVGPNQVLNPDLLLSANTTATTLSFGDFPGGLKGLSLTFDTWLVSENADSSFHAFEGGFTWGFTISTNGVRNATAPTALAGGPTAAQYQNIIGGFATSVPEPAAIAFFALGTLAFRFAVRRKN
jgi:hypothetical protein